MLIKVIYLIPTTILANAIINIYYSIFLVLLSYLSFSNELNIIMLSFEIIFANLTCYSFNL